MAKSAEAFRTISEVAEILDTPAHVLRFWESQFAQIKPMKRAGSRRYYRPQDVALIAGIRKLLHDDGLTIRGVQKILREQGVRHVASLVEPGAVPPAVVAPAPVAEPTSPAVQSVSVETAPAAYAPETAAARSGSQGAPAEREPGLPFGEDADPDHAIPFEAPMQVDVPVESHSARVHSFPGASGPEPTPQTIAARLHTADPDRLAGNRDALASLYRRLAVARDRRRAAPAALADTGPAPDRA